MIDSVVEPLHRRQSVHYQPHAWRSHGRAGQINASPKVLVVIIEGVGAARRELTYRLDAAVWVLSDVGEAERRGCSRRARAWHRPAARR